MTEMNRGGGAFQDLEAAMAALEQEQRKLAEISEVRENETTTVQAKDRSLEMTFDGSGELSELKFNGTKYRSMAPAQLAHVIVETLQQGRAQAMAKMTDLMGSDALPGIDLAGIAAGKVDPSSVIDALLSPMLDGIVDDDDRPGKDSRAEKGGQDG
ncbi:MULTISPECIES: YbaB/EbfC family nucleoid-associated protein [unclassified Saccharopolyspora]|uniref:YbaB/EbfC family nucleoid-associated protein n=1 Tax=unclassified Saccharopolyspora TaxID=2646250 RepID=UPI001CD41148|nr:MULTISPECIES: YbaB/EbfC family nucleoid-associated protein [unclassified Saccharopolyspora]MCA1191282.1 YbaB/EbfC family nucleoid-associated protein [Saccharopolyspora sp. 6V]MCA1225117.1 YbaB/EbfC family nucleoid-associated protein [Saccharopolyspora sp. 6M]MCA1281496.1 YbaB/EbfC family nucleoid-associated protein [Saccharopolyspora sp. 7B]